MKNLNNVNNQNLETENWYSEQNNLDNYPDGMSEFDLEYVGEI